MWIISIGKYCKVTLVTLLTHTICKQAQCHFRLATITFKAFSQSVHLKLAILCRSNLVTIISFHNSYLSVSESRCYLQRKFSVRVLSPRSKWIPNSVEGQLSFVWFSPHNYLEQRSSRLLLLAENCNTKKEEFLYSSGGWRLKLN